VRYNGLQKEGGGLADVLRHVERRPPRIEPLLVVRRGLPDFVIDLVGAEARLQEGQR